MKAKFGLAQKAINEISKELNKAVANTYSLYIKTLHCHWNIDDPRFISLHEMLQDQYEQLAENGDLLAERLRQMGSSVDASLESFAKISDLPKIKQKASGDEMILHLANCHEKAFIHLRELSEIGEEYKDFGLVDLLGSIIRDHEKTAWFLRSHL